MTSPEYRAMPPPLVGRADGLLNLLQSISRACGGPARYPELFALPANRLQEARHIVLLLIDGFGQAMFDTLPANAALRRHFQATLRSVFPSTTAAAVGTCLTGLAPAAHGLTGWHVRHGTPARTLAILPLTAREAGRTPSPEELETLLPELFPYPTLFEQLTSHSIVLSPRNIALSPFNRWHARGAEIVAHDGITDLCRQTAARLHAAQGPEYVYAYYPEIDSLAHRHGWRSPQVARAISQLDAAFADLVDALRGQNVWLIVTADHGFIDCPAERQIVVNDHPAFAALLASPLSGEPRVAYAHVLPRRQDEFAAYIKANLAHAIDLHPSRELIDAGTFGPPPWHPALGARLGDFTLIMREDWTIKDWLPGERPYRLIGQHGGTSAEEMRIPLIAAHL